ncbi:MAG: peptide chain release factor N(5)-glutamine methyltransferase [Acidimicrobiia bacterium]|nr:peptide chain release factor N(5)-glutamine methyltransferase [Acidimicrobiia bacterium]
MTAGVPDPAAAVGATPTWRGLLAQAAGRIGLDDARRIVEEATGRTPTEALLALDEPATALTHDQFRKMIDRRAAGEPLQYVLGRWGFRRLDLAVDRRVLIPRPETEWVVEAALAHVPTDRSSVVVDLGTGSGAIALAVADERWPRVRVVGTDTSVDALAMARANLAGLGRRATGVELHAGDWWAALPGDLRGGIDVVVSNPPYVAESDPLPAEVAHWEPTGALVAGPSGLEALEVVVGGAPVWLRCGGVLVCEIGETQGGAVHQLAGAAGLVGVEIRPDPSGRDRILVARAPG